MNNDLLVEIVNACCVRRAQGDCKTVQQPDALSMELVIVDLWKKLADRDMTTEQQPADQGRGVGEECAAISTGHKFGPFGPDKETQCEYCGESPDFPECSGTPNDCPENEGYGCCKSIPKPDRHPSHTWQEDNDEQP